MTKQELMERRKATVDRYYKEQDELEKKAKSNKHLMEKLAIDEQMALEKHKRKTIKNDKKTMLKDA